ncbi:NADP-dependent oxidoreductase [Kitasatospora sp. NPDC048540]|uniref:NADP-dependent oxidoreductase n=1 Tax=unclassified Kitasatospora TaxID=2633591 RepID=UPI0005397285|nr:NADP-dependent oxidoreductase [Kitasatospora sp. MBT63]
MKAAFIQQYGPIEDVVEVGEQPAPPVRPHDVLIEVHSAGVNPIDYIVASGAMRGLMDMPLPMILGNDASGVVVEVGEDVVRFAVGDEVFTRVDPRRPGTFAQYVAVPESYVALMPHDTTFEEAASLPLAALTAWQGLVERAEVNAGDRVLVHAGAGGVGSLAIQLAKQRGATVATTVSADSVQQALDHGADEVIDYRSQNLAETGADFDVVLDTVGGQTQEQSLAVIKPGGLLLSVLPLAPATLEQAAARDLRVEPYFMRPEGDHLADIAELVSVGALKPYVGRRYSLDRTKDALLFSASRRARGKIVIQVA